MKAIANLFAGRVPLWRVFWLIGLPLFFAFDMTAGCLFTGCSAFNSNGSFAGELLILWLITISSGGVLIMEIPIWRSATNYRGSDLIAALAKAYVCVTAFAALFPMMATAHGLWHYVVAGSI
jgi:hypothetical protein